MQLQYSLLRSIPSSSPGPSTSFPLPPLRSLPRVVCWSLGDRWNLQNIDSDAVQERLTSWFLKARTVITEVAGPLVNSGPGIRSDPPADLENVGIDEVVMPVPEMTVNWKTPNGVLSLEAAVSIEQFSRSETWVLEFVDFGGEMRRDVWHAFISEIISVYEFIREFGPQSGDPSVRQVYGAHKGKSRAIKSVANSIARLQCLQFIRKLSEDPAKLVQFSYLRSVPFGDVVLQTLAVNFWGGPLITKYRQTDRDQARKALLSEGIVSFGVNVFDIDGSAYLHNWMRSPSWALNPSVLFWKNTSVRQGIILSKNLVVADLNTVERAALTCREKSQIVDQIRATIDAAMIKGIPSNIDLFKELMFPFVVMANNFEKLRRWEDPYLTVSFLAFTYTVIFRNLLAYVLPVTFIIMAAAMLLLKGLKEQGRLGRSFGKVTIRDQPPSNTIQKIVALKEAMADLEDQLQRLNVTLLKFRTILLAGQPQTTTEVALVLLCAATALLLVPFRYILSFIILDLFTRELEFRRETVTKFRALLKERWAAVHAPPVVILPYETAPPSSPRDSLPKKKSEEKKVSNNP
ncbi:unnamed protein product [Spirodela intermedia]|uniref:Uncharacterized protein n=1 Tax=Spirodela intermedia TaxID=51605 RepID=A0A7I8IS49_SPIIN|nr:unnamed protein product [Spirodela intermedia]CAA6660585.1 unnamed protein product [Spirodela intermedia]